MLRRLFNFLSLNSLLICVALCTTWVSQSVLGNEGYLYLKWESDKQIHEVLVTDPCIVRYHFSRTMSGIESCPLSVVILLAAVLPATWLGIKAFVHIRRRRQRSERLCLICGYDLRASPQRCPECGAAAAGAAGRV